MKKLCQPNSDSILFDLDETLFSMRSTMLARIGKRYAGIDRFESIPITQHVYNRNGLLAMSFAMNTIVQPRLYCDQKAFPKVHELVQKLIEDGFDVWFVTMPQTHHNKQQSIEEKRAQIQRYFGIEASKKMIFNNEKQLVSGKYLVDDSSKFVHEEERAQWKAILMR